ncbi:MAG: phosphatase PAP2 family protein [Dehalococcoidales bacterium]|nr:phosphatase PAP2 family protein [Dehalococcoidales bacterium]
MPRRRFFWLTVILVSLALYFPINRVAHGGMQLSLPIDRLVPLLPSAIVPYLFGDVLFVGLPVWAAFRAKPGEFESYTISILLATGIAYIIYLTVPTFVTRPEITATDVFSNMLRLLYQTDRVYNAAPSGHAVYTTLSFLYLSRWKPKWRLVWLAGAALILASTLLTRQHYVLDMAAGITVASMAYFIGRFVGKRLLNKRPDNFTLIK